MSERDLFGDANIGTVLFDPGGGYGGVAGCTSFNLGCSLPSLDAAGDGHFPVVVAVRLEASTVTLYEPSRAYGPHRSVWSFVFVAKGTVGANPPAAPEGLFGFLKSV